MTRQIGIWTSLLEKRVRGTKIIHSVQFTCTILRILCLFSPRRLKIPSTIVQGSSYTHPSCTHTQVSPRRHSSCVCKVSLLHSIFILHAALHTLFCSLYILFAAERAKTRYAHCFGHEKCERKHNALILFTGSDESCRGVMDVRHVRKERGGKKKQCSQIE
jgi:hypothetical protein